MEAKLAKLKLEVSRAKQPDLIPLNLYPLGMGLALIGLMSFLQMKTSLKKSVQSEKRAASAPLQKVKSMSLSTVADAIDDLSSPCVCVPCCGHLGL